MQGSGKIVCYCLWVMAMAFRVKKEIHKDEKIKYSIFINSLTIILTLTSMWMISDIILSLVA